MDIEPVVSQSLLIRTQDVKTELETERFVQQGAYKNEMEKYSQKQFTEVREPSELESLVDENGNNNDRSQSSKKQKNKKNTEKQIEKNDEYETELKKKATNRGTLFDFKA